MSLTLAGFTVTVFTCDGKKAKNLVGTVDTAEVKAYFSTMLLHLHTDLALNFRMVCKLPSTV